MKKYNENIIKLSFFGEKEKKKENMGIGYNSSAFEYFKLNQLRSVNYFSCIKLVVDE